MPVPCATQCEGLTGGETVPSCFVGVKVKRFDDWTQHGLQLDVCETVNHHLRVKMAVQV